MVCTSSWCRLVNTRWWLTDPKACHDIHGSGNKCAQKVQRLIYLNNERLFPYNTLKVIESKKSKV